MVRPLLSGKEAQIYLVHSGGELRVAKAFKDAQQRSFKNRAQYTEGRRVRNSRDQRAMAKGSRYGKAREELGWKTTEVDTIYRLREAGVRVPEPFIFSDGVLVMELVTDAQGHPAPRLSDLRLNPLEAQKVFDQLLREVVKMLCAGIVHGDLSDFNVLMGPDGPVIIDFPQALNAAGNSNAQRILVRDVNNLQRFLARHVHRSRRRPYGKEMWAAYERSELTPDYELTGKFTSAPQKTETKSLLDQIAEVEREHRQKRRALGLEEEAMPPPQIAPVTKEEVEQFKRDKAAARAVARAKNEKGDEAAPKRKRRRRRRKKAGAQGGGNEARQKSAGPSSAAPRTRDKSAAKSESGKSARSQPSNRSRKRNRTRNRKRSDNRTAPRSDGRT